MDPLTVDRFLVQQKARIVEVEARFDIFDPRGVHIGAFSEMGQSKLKKLARIVSSVDQYLTRSFALRDAAGEVLLSIERPAKLVKSKIHVRDGEGGRVGSIIQQNAIGKIRFELQDASGKRVGALLAENWRAWNFRIEDAGGREVARITKKWAGAVKEMFTVADNYMVDIEPGVDGSLRRLAVAAAVAIDTALKSDARGLN